MSISETQYNVMFNNVQLLLDERQALIDASAPQADIDAKDAEIVQAQSEFGSTFGSTLSVASSHDPIIEKKKKLTNPLDFIKNPESDLPAADSYVALIPSIVTNKRLVASKDPPQDPYFDTVSSHPADLHVEVYGDSSKRPMILLSGQSMTSVHWYSLMSKLVEDFHLIAVHKRGTKPSTQFSDADHTNLTGFTSGPFSVVQQSADIDQIVEFARGNVNDKVGNPLVNTSGLLPVLVSVNRGCDDINAYFVCQERNAFFHAAEDRPSVKVAGCCFLSPFAGDNFSDSYAVAENATFQHDPALADIESWMNLHTTSQQGKGNHDKLVDEFRKTDAPATLDLTTRSGFNRHWGHALMNLDASFYNFVNVPVMLGYGAKDKCQKDPSNVLLNGVAAVNDNLRASVSVSGSCYPNSGNWVQMECPDEVAEDLRIWHERLDNKGASTTFIVVMAPEYKVVPNGMEHDALGGVGMEEHINSVGGKVLANYENFGVLVVEGPLGILADLNGLVGVDVAAPDYKVPHELRMHGPTSHDNLQLAYDQWKDSLASVGNDSVNGGYGGSDIYDDHQWNTLQVVDNHSGAGNSWDLNTGSHNTVVGVLGFGVNDKHIDLNANILKKWQASNVVQQFGLQPGDDDFFGISTMAVGCMAAQGRSRGVAPNIGVNSYKCMGLDGYTMRGLLEGLNEAIEVDKVNVLLHLCPHQVVNTSAVTNIKGEGLPAAGVDVSGNAAYKALGRVYAWANKQKIVVVDHAGFGPHGGVNAASIPDSYVDGAIAGPLTLNGPSHPGVIGVGGVGKNNLQAMDKFVNPAVPVTNWGVGVVDLVAPVGHSDPAAFLSEMATGPSWRGPFHMIANEGQVDPHNRYLSFSHSFTGAAYVAGVAALVIDLAKRNSVVLTPNAVASLLNSTALDSNNAVKGAYDGVFGNGSVNAFGALTSAAASYGALGANVAIVTPAVSDKPAPYRVMLKGTPLACSEPEGKLHTGTAQAKQKALQDGQDACIVAAGIDLRKKLHSFTINSNGMSMLLTPAERDALAADPNVVWVERDTFSPSYYHQRPEFERSRGGANDALPGFGPVWDHPKCECDGDSMIIGNLDTGIRPEHEAFADDGSYSDLFAEGLYLPFDESDRTANAFGGRDLVHAVSGMVVPDPPFTLNNKVVGARRVMDTYDAVIGAALDEYTSARVDRSHGNRTAGLMVCNRETPVLASQVFEGLNPPYTTGGIKHDGTMSGTAPRARIMTYRCFGKFGRFGSDASQAVEFAVADGIKVMLGGFGAGGPTLRGGWAELLNASEQGVICVTAAGNGGPAPGTIGNCPPWSPCIGMTTSSEFDPNAPSYWNYLNGGNSNAFLQSRGPMSFNPDLLVPNWTCPGGDWAMIGPTTDPQEVGAWAQNIPGLPAGNRWMTIGGATSWSMAFATGYVTLLKEAFPFWHISELMSAIETTTYQTVKKEDGVTQANYFAMGSGHIDLPKIFNPGLTYPANRADWIQFLVNNGEDVSVVELNPPASNGEESYQLNKASIAVSAMCATSVVIKRKVKCMGCETNIKKLKKRNIKNRKRVLKGKSIKEKKDKKVYNYSFSKVDPPGMTLTSSVATLSLKKGEEANFEITLTNVNAVFNQYHEGSYKWTLTSVASSSDDSASSSSAGSEKDCVGIEVFSPVVVQVIHLEVPVQAFGINGVGAAVGDQSFNIRTCYTGDYTAIPIGLTTDVPWPASSGIAGSRVGVGPWTVTSFSGINWLAICQVNLTNVAYATFEVDSPNGSDIDLYLFTGSFGFIGGGFTFNAVETFTVQSPPDGNYWVAARNFGGGTLPYTVAGRMWIVEKTVSTNMTVDASPASAVAGVVSPIDISWTGLTADKIYLGSVVHADGPTLASEITRTDVKVDTDPAAPPPPPPLGGFENTQQSVVKTVEQNGDVVYVHSMQNPENYGTVKIKQNVDVTDIQQTYYDSL